MAGVSTAEEVRGTDETARDQTTFGVPATVVDVTPPRLAGSRGRHVFARCWNGRQVERR